MAMTDSSPDNLGQRLRQFFGRIVGGSNDQADAKPPQDTSGGTSFVDPLPQSNFAAPIHRDSPTPNTDTPTTLAAEMSEPGLTRPVIFEPALKHWPKAFRGGEPQFKTPEFAAAWHRDRLLTLGHVLRTIEQSEHAESLVVRGSVLLATWLGNDARRPGDLDFVVLPSDWKVNDPQAKQMIDDLVAALQGSEVSDSIQIPDQMFAAEEIWTYERAPGLRVIVPWHDSREHVGGTVQLDFVFGEELPSPAIEMSLLIGDQAPIEVQAASAVQSLAWKLLWLTTDMHASGKDLYDAVLLAEFVPLDARLLKRTFEHTDDPLGRDFATFTPRNVRDWYVEWEHFQQEYPLVQGTGAEWKDRLVQALGPVWQQLGESPD
ncbi:hypothetical protein C5Y93_26325 [Blastopirellula marina]|uniref:Nucleotidyl transferase AbiEii/AbiGii toxin family protein n=2 Tax=Blastopirellula marina TaxID=124 RepID=A0A2S8GFK6_9BACT|nr:hypothetical protein C5Y93_26325 [Blastopirellula marina]